MPRRMIFDPKLALSVALAGLLAFPILAKPPRENVPSASKDDFCSLLTAQAAQMPSGKSSAWGLLPRFARSWISPHLSSARSLEIKQLMKEASDLLPPETISTMGRLNQSSHSYLFYDLFPRTKEGVRAADRARQRDWDTETDAPRFSPYVYDSMAQESAWILRVKKVRQRLQECLRLLHREQADVSAEIAAVELHLALIDSFTYGVGGIFSAGPGGAGRGQILSATTGFFNVLRHYRKTDGEDSKRVLLVQFLLGKHARNAAWAYSNSGYVGMEPDAQYSLYVALAWERLNFVIDRCESDQPGVPLSDALCQELYFESFYHLLILDERLEKLESDPARKTDPSYRKRPASLEGLLVELLKQGGRAWFEQQMPLRRYSLFHRLLNAIRWGHQMSAHGHPHEPLLRMEGPSREGSLDYDQAVQVLVERYGITVLKHNLPNTVGQRQ